VKRWLLIGATGWLIVAGDVAFAEDRKNMSAGMATQMDNAFPVSFRALQLQTVFRVEDSPRGGNVYRLEPELRWGLVQRGYVSLRPQFEFEAGVRRESGNLRAQGFYNVTDETPVLPATAVVIGTTLPTGNDAAGVDGLVRGILTKTAGPVQFNLNAELIKMGAARLSERDLRYRFGLGADIGGRTLLRAGFFVEQAEARSALPLWRAQAGIFHHVTPTMAIAVGAEVGLSSSAPDYQFIVGFQHTFTGFR